MVLSAAVRRTASIGVAATGWLFAAVSALTLVYPSLSSTFVFLSYILIFNLLPGVVIARLLLPRIQTLGIFLIYAFAIGLIANVLMFIPSWIFGYPSLLKLWPLIGVASLLVLWRHLRFGELLQSWRVGHSEANWAATASLACGTSLLMMGFFLGATNKYDFDAYSMHFGFQGVFVRGLQTGWRPPNLLLPDIPISYNYLAHLWVLAAYQNTSLDIPELVSRYGPILFFGSAISTLLAFSRHVLALPWWASTLSIVAVWWVFGVPPITGQFFGTFTPLAAGLIMSTSFAFVIYFVTITLVLESLRGTSSEMLPSGLAISVLSFAATGARGVAGPILICALTFLGAVLAVRQKALCVKSIAFYAIAAALGCVGAVLLFFIFGTEFSGMGFLEFNWQPFTFLADPSQYLLSAPRILMSAGAPSLLAGVAGFAVIVLFQAAFLLPGLVYNLSLIMGHGASHAEWLLIGTALAGIGGFFFFTAPGYSHITFLQYSNISMSMLGAQGLHWAFSSGAGQAPLSYRKPGGAALIASTAALLLVHMAQVPAMPFGWIRDHASGLADLVSGLDRTALWPAPWSCIQDPDVSDIQDPDVSDFLVRAQTSVDDPVVMIVPTQKVSLGPCETFWATTLHPVQTMNNYAFHYVPGRGKGIVQHRLVALKNHFVSILSNAKNGILDAEDVIAISDGFSRPRQVFVLTGKDIQFEAHPRIAIAAQGEHLVLLSVRTNSVLNRVGF